MAVTDADVKVIISTSKDTAPFIATAALIVTEKLTGQGLSSQLLDKITLYLAAHLVAISASGGSGAVTRSKLGDADESYATAQSSAALGGLRVTSYGQTAIMLDPTGILAGMSASSGLKSLFTVVPAVED